jgi:DNA-binding MarR family transcriptional regulator
MSNALNDTQRKNLNTFIDCIEQFRTLDADMPTQTLLAFLYAKVLEDEEDQATVRQIAGKLHTTSSSASRNILAHTTINRHRKEGTGLVETHENPMKRNEKIIRITPKGERFLSTILGRLSDS